MFVIPCFSCYQETFQTYFSRMLHMIFSFFNGFKVPYILWIYYGNKELSVELNSHAESLQLPVSINLTTVPVSSLFYSSLCLINIIYAIKWHQLIIFHIYIHWRFFFSKTIIIRVLEDIQNSLERRNKKIFMCIYMIEIWIYMIRNIKFLTPSQI